MTQNEKNLKQIERIEEFIEDLETNKLVSFETSLKYHEILSNNTLKLFFGIDGQNGINGVRSDSQQARALVIQDAKNMLKIIKKRFI